jgi:deoxyadenosine/deoxycytidine kinase
MGKYTLSEEFVQNVFKIKFLADLNKNEKYWKSFTMKTNDWTIKLENYIFEIVFEKPASLTKYISMFVLNI